MPSLDALVQQARSSFGRGAGVRVVAAPGRVNLMGDHTDYNDGFVLPMAIDRSCTVVATPTDGRVVRARLGRARR